MGANQIDRIYEQMKAQQFERHAKLPISWRNTSFKLKRAADKLFDCYHDATLRGIQQFVDEVKNNQRIEETKELTEEELEDHFDSQLIFVYFLLIGYALENLLKGILLIDHPEYFKPNSKMTDIRSHDLVKLCSRCNIPMQEEEANLLEKLTIHIEWQGKYPIPLESEKMWPHKQVDGSWKDRGEEFRGRKTQEEVNNLYMKLWDELERRRSTYES